MFRSNTENILAQYRSVPPTSDELRGMNENDLNILYYEHLPEYYKKITHYGTFTGDLTGENKFSVDVQSSSYC